jgi:dTDP-4-amino-4,6-dideoxygalactose transaminase
VAQPADRHARNVAVTTPWRVPLVDVRIPAEAIAAAAQTLEGSWLSNGPAVERFEAAFAAYVGCEHAVACSSGTAALSLALASTGVGPGDEIIMPALSFVAAANAATQLGATPVFADVVGEDDLTLDPDHVARLIGPRTAGVIVMHYGGHPCSPAVVDLARERGIALIEDAAHAAGAAGPPGMCGSWGAAGCFSFYANKNLPLGEGGMLTTSDGALADRARQLRSQGITSAAWERHVGRRSGYDVTSIGYSVRLDEARAAMGTVILEWLDEHNADRARIVTRYRALLAEVEGVAMAFSRRPAAGERLAHHLVVAVLDPDRDREQVVVRMHEAGIQTSIHYPPIHRLTAHRRSSLELPVTDRVAGRVLTLPLYPHLQPEQVDEVVDALRRSL